MARLFGNWPEGSRSVSGRDESSTLSERPLIKHTVKHLDKDEAGGAIRLALQEGRESSTLALGFADNLTGPVGHRRIGLGWVSQSPSPLPCPQRHLDMECSHAPLLPSTTQTTLAHCTGKKGKPQSIANVL